LRPHRREGDLVDVAPAPVLARLGRADDRVPALSGMRRRVAGRGGVAAADLPAGHAHAEMDPAAADLQALLAAFDRLREGGHLDLVEVAADGSRRHDVSFRCVSAEGARARPRNRPRRLSTTTAEKGPRAPAPARMPRAGTWR